jgi:hypothetical protein
VCKTCGYIAVRVHIAKMCRTGGKKENLVHMVQQDESIEEENRTDDNEYFNLAKKLHPWPDLIIFRLQSDRVEPKNL